MARINTAAARAPLTHEGAVAFRLTPEAQLRRSVMSCLLWEREAYEDGKSVAERIKEHAANVSPEVLAQVAVEARHTMHLRHVPLWLLVQLCRTGRGKRGLVADTIERVISRADEPGELLALYQKDNGGDQAPLSNPLKIGLAKALGKFDAYQLSKYAKQGDIRLRDVMFLTHPKAQGIDRINLYRDLAEDDLSPSDAGTWEAELSAGADKKATFERLISENKLGYLALLRNLRNMIGAGCDAALIENALLARRGAERVLPFRFFAAFRHAPQFEFALSSAMLANVENTPKLKGRTILVADVSGSMGAQLSAKSELTRYDVAGALIAVAREICEESVVYVTGDKTVKMDPKKRGLAVMQEIRDRGLRLGGGGGIFTAAMCSHIARYEKGADRLIVITDEQDCGPGRSARDVTPPAGVNYMINVGSARNGVGYGKFTHIDGWSDNVLRYIAAAEDMYARENNDTVA